MKKRKLMQRKDGSYYLFAEETFSSLKARAEELVSCLNRFFPVLEQYEATSGRGADYLRNVIRGGAKYIETEARETLSAKFLTDVPFGKQTRNRLIEEMLEEIPETLYSEVTACYADMNKLFSYGFPKIEADDLIIEEKEGSLSVSLPKTVNDDYFRQVATTDIDKRYIDDLSAFSANMAALWELKDKGYNLKAGYDAMNGVVVPSIVEDILSIDNQEAREQAVSLEALLNSQMISKKIY